MSDRERLTEALAGRYTIEGEIGAGGDLAPQVAAPTLVLHSNDDARVPFKEGRRLASMIPGARFVPLESKNHIPLEGEPAWSQFVEAVRDFLESGPGSD
jgi:pimeloyl-ACP methyl ester carboxylesterase